MNQVAPRTMRMNILVLVVRYRAAVFVSQLCPPAQISCPRRLPSLVQPVGIDELGRRVVGGGLNGADESVFITHGHSTRNALPARYSSTRSSYSLRLSSSTSSAARRPCLTAFSKSPTSAHAVPSVSTQYAASHFVSSQARVASSTARGPSRTSGSGHVASIHARWFM